MDIRFQAQQAEQRKLQQLRPQLQEHRSHQQLQNQRDQASQARDFSQYQHHQQQNQPRHHRYEQYSDQHYAHYQSDFADTYQPRQHCAPHEPVQSAEGGGGETQSSVVCPGVNAAVVAALSQFAAAIGAAEKELVGPGPCIGHGSMPPLPARLSQYNGGGGGGRRGGAPFRGGSDSDIPGRGHDRGIGGKVKPKQAAWCGLCRVELTSVEMLDEHKNGKRHKKNVLRVEELENANKPRPVIQSEQKLTDQSITEVSQQPETQNHEKNQPVQVGGGELQSSVVYPGVNAAAAAIVAALTQFATTIGAGPCIGQDPMPQQATLSQYRDGGSRGGSVPDFHGGGHDQTIEGPTHGKSSPTKPPITRDAEIINQDAGPETTAPAAKLKPKQAAWCELCRADITSLEILDQHINGKRHRRNALRTKELKNGIRSMPAVQSEKELTDESFSKVSQKRKMRDTQVGKRSKHEGQLL